MASLISEVNQIDWALFHSFLFHWYVKIKDVSKNFIPAVDNVFSVLKNKSGVQRGFTQIIHEFLSI